MSILLLLGATAHALPPHMECWPISQRIAEQVLRAPPPGGEIVVVVEESVCDASGTAPRIEPGEVAESVEAVVRSVDEALGRPRSPIVSGGGVLRVVAGDAAFLDRRVDVEPAACPAQSTDGWTGMSAPCCVLAQVGDGTFAPCVSSPVCASGSGFLVPAPISFTATDLPLLDALLALSGAIGREPLAVLFLSSPGEPDGRPSRRLVYRPIHPPSPPFAQDAFWVAPEPRRRRGRR